MKPFMTQPSWLGLETSASEWFSVDTILPAPGQAALAVQCRSDDFVTRAPLSHTDDPEVRDSVTAERTSWKNWEVAMPSRSRPSLNGKGQSQEVGFIFGAPSFRQTGARGFS